MPDPLIRVGRHRHAGRPTNEVVSLPAPSFFAPMLASIVLGLSVLDAMATMNLMAAGGEEANPVMRFLLARGTGTFLAGKLVLTTAGLAVLLAAGRRSLFGFRLQSTHILQGLAAIYATVIVYELALGAMPAP